MYEPEAEEALGKWSSSKYAKLAGRGILSKDDLPVVTPKAARYHDNPVLTRGGAGAWDEGRVDNPCVIFDSQDEQYEMWYSGRDADGHNGRTGYAVSTTDGISWTKDPDNPLFNDPDEQGYANHHTEVADVITDYWEDSKVYLMQYEQQLTDSNWNTKKIVPKVAKSTDGRNWTVVGKVTSVAEGEGYDGGKLWVDRDGKYHLLVKLWPYTTETPIPSIWHHFISEDFETWEREGEMELGHEIFSKSYGQVDDFELVPFGRYLLGFVNYYSGSNVARSHEPLEMMAGLSWNNMQKIGNCIYPAKEIAEGDSSPSYHESTFAIGPTDYGECPRIYYFQQWDPDAGSVTSDINMAYLMLGEKRTYPVLTMSSLAGGNSTSVGWGGDCTEIPLEGVDTLNLMVELTYDASATADPGARIHLRSSSDGVDYDTQDYTSFDVALDAGATVRKTANITPDPEFLQVKVENLTDYDITDLEVRAVLG